MKLNTLSHAALSTLFTSPTPRLNTHKIQDIMAPRKKTEEKASANEAADMVLHYLRQSLPTHAKHASEAHLTY
jgi:hypothetical protein